MAEFTICVALVTGDRPLLGFVYNPATEEMFEARLGRGATRNGQPMRATVVADLDEAHIVASRFESRRRNFASLIPTAALSSLGSLAYKLALVAAGRYDGYLSWRRTHDWDIAAAVLLLEEAGGRIADAAGGSIHLNQPEPVHSGILAAGTRLYSRSCSRPRPRPTPPIAPTGGHAACRIERPDTSPPPQLW